MDAFRSLVFTAVIAGLVSGGLVSWAHQFGTGQIIARAEIYEKAALDAEQASTAAATYGDAVASPNMDDMGHGSAAVGWQPRDGIERTAYTVLADMVTAVAFSLILVAGLDLRGGNVDWRTGLFWGLAGFATFTLAPGLGLPTEVQGTAAAPLHARQIWWVAIAAPTVSGLALLFLQHHPVLVMAGVVLLVAPHLYDAPQPTVYKSAAPESLAYEFVVITIVTSPLFWIVLGTLSGFFYNSLRPSSSEPAGLGPMRLFDRATSRLVR